MQSPYLLGCQVAHAARDVSREPKEVLHDVVVDVLSVASEPLVQLSTLAVLKDHHGPPCEMMGDNGMLFNSLDLMKMKINQKQNHQVLR